MNRCFLFAMLAMCGSSAFGHDDEATKSAIQKVRTKIIAAMKSSDLTALKSYFTDDFTVSDEEKKIYKKDQWMKVTAQLLKAVKVKTITMDIVTIKVAGNTAILHTKSSLAGTFEKDGKSQALIDNSTDEETWIKTVNGWKFKKDITLSESGTLDGKPISK